MKKIIHFFICIFLVFSSFLWSPAVAYAVDGDIVQYEIYNEEGKLLTYSSEVEIGDTILTRDFVEYQIYGIEGERCYARVLRQLNKPVQTREKKQQKTKEKRICLYMTHNDESYTLTDGYDSIYGAGGIHDVARKLRDKLQDEGIEVVLDESLHIPHNSSAYARSAVTAKSLYDKESPDALFDIHRDGVGRKYYLANNNGEEYSKIRIVVGKSNPNFEDNYKFAQEVFAAGNELYPWLFLDIYCGKGHYNQEIMRTNLLFEMGTYLIEKELVFKSVPALADTIDKVMYSGVIEDDKSGNIAIEDSFEEDNSSVLVDDKVEKSEKRSVVPLVFVVISLGGLLVYAFVSILKKKTK